jgi:hypothetical protein
VAQGRHCESRVALPSAPTNSPGAHIWCEMQALAGFASWSQVPSGQGAAGSIPPGQICPAPHFTQAASFSAVPAGHAPTATQTTALGAMLVEPAGQTWHRRSCEAEPCRATPSPGRHVVHGSQVALLGPAEKLPGGHAVHARFETSEPSPATYIPGPHVSWGTQALAGLPS